MKNFDLFCDSVLSGIPRATKRERADIREELLDHLESHKEVLLGYGVEEEQAEREAVEAMGDAGKIGAAWNAMLSPFWLWLGRLCCAACVFIVLFNLSDIYYKADRLFDSLGIRYGAETASESRDLTGYDLIWETDPGIRKKFGEHIIRIERVELYERITGPLQEYVAQVYFVSWHQDIFGQSLNYSALMQTEKYGPGVTDKGGGGSQSGYATWARDRLEVEKGLEAIEISFDYNGNHLEATVPLDWGGATP
jgi:hypothetical protein